MGRVYNKRRVLGLRDNICYIVSGTISNYNPHYFAFEIKENTAFIPFEVVYFIEDKSLLPLIKCYNDVRKYKLKQGTNLVNKLCGNNTQAIQSCYIVLPAWLYSFLKGMYGLEYVKLISDKQSSQRLRYELHKINNTTYRIIDMLHDLSVLFIKGDYVNTQTIEYYQSAYFGVEKLQELLLQIEFFVCVEKPNYYYYKKR